MSAADFGSRRRRSWLQRFALTFNVLAITSALAAAGIIYWSKHTLNQVERVDLPSQSITPSSELASGEPQNFLLVGIDSEEGLAEDSPLRNDRDGGRRSDTIIIVRVDPKDKEARMLSFPRDLWVEIPKHGNQKINAAMTYGQEAGPALLADTIKKNFDIEINHYLEVNFAGFISLVNPLRISSPMISKAAVCPWDLFS